MADAVSVPGVNLLVEVAAAVAHEPTRRLAILATTPTVELQLYRDVLQKQGISPVYPDPTSQQLIMELLYQSKPTIVSATCKMRC
jgi:aspartate racemase